MTSNHGRGKREAGPVCLRPWTTMQVHTDGSVVQCCGAWTVGKRGNLNEMPLRSIWNGKGYAAARRAMGRGYLKGLCRPSCPRLHDRGFMREDPAPLIGAEKFSGNEILVAADISGRREMAKGLPRQIVINPSSRCNFDCIMCPCGRMPAQEISPAVWGQIRELLPHMRALTLNGGEPLLNPDVIGFLKSVDYRDCPDLKIAFSTNGSLLTRRLLSGMSHCPLGEIIISINAGTPAVHKAVHRNRLFGRVLENIEGLAAFRDQVGRRFGITLSFLVLPMNVHTLPEFGRIARTRGLGIRILTLNPETCPELDYFQDKPEAARVVGALDGFAASVRRGSPEWIPEILAARNTTAFRAGLEAAPHALPSSPHDFYESPVAKANPGSAAGPGAALRSLAERLRSGARGVVLDGGWRFGAIREESDGLVLEVIRRGAREEFVVQELREGGAGIIRTRGFEVSHRPDRSAAKDSLMGTREGDRLINSLGEYFGKLYP